MGKWQHETLQGAIVQMEIEGDIAGGNSYVRHYRG